MSKSKRSLTITLAMAAGLLSAREAEARPTPAPSWLRWGSDLSRRTEPALAPLDRARLAEFEREKQSYVDRLRRYEYALGADGQVTERLVVARQLLSDAGVREAGTLFFSARAATDHVVIEGAHVIGPGGKRTPFDPTLVQIRASNQSDLFSDVQEVALPFGGLKAGDTVVLSVTWQHDGRQWPLPWSTAVYLQSSAPIEKLEVSVSWTPSMAAPQWKTDAPGLQCRTKDRTLACVQERIPAILSDPDVVSWPDLIPQMVITNETHWDALIAHERKLLDQADTSPAVQRLADDLVGDARSVSDRVESIFRFVADKIRYVGLEHGRNAVTPRPPATTLARGFGDCKDKVLLFLSLARAAGLDPYPVLIASGHRSPEKLLLPNWKYFDHVIACVKNGRKRICLDPTDPQLPAGELAFGTRNAVALPLYPAATPMRLDDGVNPKPAWDILVKSENRVDCDGTIHETLNRSFRSASAGYMRAVLDGRAEEQKQWLEQDFARTMGPDVRPEFSVAGLAEKSSAVTITSKAKFPGSKALRDSAFYAESDAWLQSFGRNFRTDNRNHPYELSGLRIVSVTSYEICPEVKVTHVGPVLDLKDDFGELTSKYEFGATRVKATSQLVLKRQRIPRDRLSAFNKFLKVISDQARISFGLTPTEEKAP